MANSIPTFAVASYGNIQNYINQGILIYPSYVFCKDKNTLVFIDKNLQIQDIKGFNQASMIVVEELPTENIQSNTFYLCNGKGYLLINDILVPVFKDISDDITSYDQLEDLPLVNKRGTISSPIVLADLGDGCYSITGQYKIGGDLNTIYVQPSNAIFIIESDESNKYMTKLDGKSILVYTLSSETMTVTSDEYATQNWVEAQGYTTKTYVDEAIDNLYKKITNEALVSITKVSQLVNDMGYLTADDLGEIENSEIFNLFDE